MTTLDTRALRLHPGEQCRESRTVELAPLELSGERYLFVPPEPEAAVTVTRTSNGLLFELVLDLSLEGACFRCLGRATLPLRIRSREYEGGNSGDPDELRTPYFERGVLDLSAWTRDAVVLALPEKILCREDCAGLCPHCGADLNEGVCAHVAEQGK